MGLKFGFIGAKAAHLCGKKYDEATQSQAIQLCHEGTLDIVVVFVKSGKNGCNLQGMSWMVSLGYIGQATDEEQAKGTFNYMLQSNIDQEDAAGWGSSNRQGFMFFGSKERRMIRLCVTRINFA